MHGWNLIVDRIPYRVCGEPVFSGSMARRWLQQAVQTVPQTVARHFCLLWKAKHNSTRGAVVDTGWPRHVGSTCNKVALPLTKACASNLDSREPLFNGIPRYRQNRIQPCCGRSRAQPFSHHISYQRCRMSTSVVIQVLNALHPFENCFF
jgi:hypothetical protein